MQIIQKIVTWAAEQPAWIDDAIRRLLAGSLTPGDLQDIAALAKHHHGLPAPLGIAAVRLDPTSIPSSAQVNVDVSLIALRRPTNLNAIDNNQALTFNGIGLTVVYGQNGAGKSGYARALKKACRARDVESILPDVYAASSGTLFTGATFEWNEGNVLRSQEWIANTIPPAPLSQMSVFDSHCARVFVDNQARVLFVPCGMDVIHSLSEALGAVQRLIETDRKANQFDVTQLSTISGTTLVGLALAKLGPKSNPETFIKLAVLSTEEEAERQAISRLLRDEDPVKLATRIRRNTTRLRTMRDELSALETPLANGTLSQLANAFASMTAAENASKLAAEMLQAGGTFVEGTGTEPWEVLLRSAAKYATEIAYPANEFPGPNDAHCVLCQQPLTGEAFDRLKSFFQFIEADAQKKATESREATKKLYRAISTLSFETFPSDRALLDELGESEPALSAAIREYVSALGARRASVLATAANRELNPQAAPPTSPILALDELIEKQTTEVAHLEMVLTLEERERKSKVLMEFEARAKLAQLLPKVLDAIEWHRRDHAFGEAVKGCNTRLVTTFIGELYESHVTEELRSAFTQELADLGLSKLDVALEMTGQKGARMQQLKLRTLPQYARSKVSDILSEGEQRVIAMALFLAEVGVEPGRSGLIFDDPVSSLDHLRREKIAKRLVLEAKSRQIIIFTHDLGFAWSLKDFAKEYGVANESRHIFSAGTKKGICNDNLPFEAKKLSARVNELREQAKRAKKALEEDSNHEVYNDTVRNGYRRMRDTWELLIEEHLFGGTVKRFRRSIDTKQLRYVSVSDKEASAVYNGMTRCSSFTHEGGGEAPPALPDPDDFLADVEELAAALKLIDDNKKSTETRRSEDGLATAA